MQSELSDYVDLHRDKRDGLSSVIRHYSMLTVTTNIGLVLWLNNFE